MCSFWRCHFLTNLLSTTSYTHSTDFFLLICSMYLVESTLTDTSKDTTPQKTSYTKFQLLLAWRRKFHLLAAADKKCEVLSFQYRKVSLIWSVKSSSYGQKLKNLSFPPFLKFWESPCRWQSSPDEQSLKVFNFALQVCSNKMRLNVPNFSGSVITFFQLFLAYYSIIFL